MGLGPIWKIRPSMGLEWLVGFWAYWILGLGLSLGPNLVRGKIVLYPNYGLIVMDWNPIINWMLFGIDSSGICQTSSHRFIRVIQ